MEFFLFATTSRLDLQPTQSPIQRVPGAITSGTKRSGREADLSPSPIAEVMSAWSYTFLPQNVFMAWCL